MVPRWPDDLEERLQPPAEVFFLTLLCTSLRTQRHTGTLIDLSVTCKKYGPKNTHRPV